MYHGLSTKCKAKIQSIVTDKSFISFIHYYNKYSLAKNSFSLYNLREMVDSVIYFLNFSWRGGGGVWSQIFEIAKEILNQSSL